MIKQLLRYGLPYVAVVFLIGVFGFPLACGGGSGTAADQAGVGSECTKTSDCDQSKFVQACLLNFAGGYCGIKDCTGDADCPDGSLCVEHTDGTNYCFLECQDKSDCNINRSSANESNCSSNITFTDPQSSNTKACVPPSGV